MTTTLSTPMVENFFLTKEGTDEFLIDYCRIADRIDLFDRINIAHCAMQRAKQYVWDQDRFTAEYETARCWVKYRCCITSDYSYVERY